MPRTPSPEDADLHKKARRAGIASFIGTTIEWYDFYIYGLAAALVFGKVFFPADMDPGLATLLSFVTLWSGFIARPLGGIIFGHLGDRIGRKTTLVITLIMMGIATTCIGLLPVYTQIGIWAPISLVALRIVQGIAVGGEWGGAILIASESAPKGKGILYAAFAQQGSPTGNLLATLAFFALSALPASDFILWGWRAPFLLSAVLVIVGMVIRLKLEESEDMKRVLAQKRTVKLPLAEVLGKHWKIVLLGAGVLPIIHVTYFKSTFALSWATKTLGYSQGTFLSIIVVALVVQFLSQPLGALLTSRIDMRKAACLMVLPEFILMPAMFFAVETKVYWIAAVGMCLATVPHAMFYGAVGGILARAFPARVRYTGLSLAYQALLAAGRRRYAGTGPVDSQQYRQHRRRGPGLSLLRAGLAGLYPGPVADHRIPRQRPVDRRARRRRGLAAARSGRAGTGVARPRPASGRRSRLAGSAHAPLVLQQPALAPQATAIAGQGTVRTDDAVAGNHDGDLVGSVGAGHGAHRRRRADGPGQPGVALRAAARYLAQRLPDRAGEGRGVQRQGGLEAHWSTAEVVGEFRLDPVDGGETAETDARSAALLQAFQAPRSTPGGRRIPAGAGPAHRPPRAWRRAGSAASPP